MKESKAAEFILNSLLSRGESGVRNKLECAVLERVRGILGRDQSKLVRYNLDGAELLLPLAHEMPLYRRAFRHYSENVGRLASYVAAKYPELKIIDIGANVGDTAAIVRAKCAAPILSIAGDEFYFQRLQANIQRSQMRDVQPCRTFVGTATAQMSGELRREGGTASFVAGFAQSLSTARLSEVLTLYPAFQGAKLLKVDTDGFDCQILESESSWLAETKPVAFIEYDPYLTLKQGYDARAIFQHLLSIGYCTCIFWENTGEYLLTAELSNISLLDDLHFYYSRHRGKKYADIALIHEDDVDIGVEIQQAERGYFRDVMRNESRVSTNTP